MYGASCHSAKENCHRVSKMRGATLAIGNRPFDAWTETFKSERLTGAILDRLTHHVSILNMNGASYRLSQSNASQAVIPPEIKGLQKWNFLGKMNEEISNEDKQIH
jgi:hypothetical protein